MTKKLMNNLQFLMKINKIIKKIESLLFIIEFLNLKEIF